MDSDLSRKINEARQSGHSDDDIAKFLTTDADIGSKVQEALDAGHSASDILGHLAPVKVDPGEEPWTVAGVPKAMARQAKDVLEGAGSGIISTGQGLYNLTRKGVKAVGLGELPPAPEFIQKAAAPTQYDAQGNPVEPSTSFGVGRTGEQAAEFVAPGGLVSKGAKAAGVFGKAAGIGARVAGDVASSAAVTAAQTGGDVEKIANAAISSGIVSGAFSTVGGILSSIPTNAVYVKRLNFPTRFQGQRVEEVVGKAIDDGILISQGGANKAEIYENLSRAERNAEVAKYANHLIDINIVRTPVLKLRQMAEQLGENGIVKQIDSRLRAFEEANGARAATKGTAAKTVTSPVLGPTGAPITSTIPGTPGTPAQPAMITMKAAQQAKDDFNLLAQNMFGKFSPGAGQIRKLMGAGIKDAMEAVSPDIARLNRNTQNYKLLKDAIEKYINTNPELMNPRTAVLALWNKPAALIYGAFSNPFIRSALAVAKDRVEKSAVVPALQAVPRLAGGIPFMSGAAQ